MKPINHEELITILKRRDKALEKKMKEEIKEGIQKFFNEKFIE